jgi:hypothetical protein
MRYVASRFHLSLRRDNLTWSHHALLASLDAEAQDYWLDRAVGDRLSVADLRVELRAARLVTVAQHEGARELSLDMSQRDSVIFCPSCGDPVPIPRSLRR